MTDPLSHAAYIDALVATLEVNVLPNTESAFVRGQIMAVMYGLFELKARADWDTGWILDHLETLDAAFSQLRDIALPDGCPVPPAPSGHSNELKSLIAARDLGDRFLTDLVGWLATAPDSPMRTKIAQIVHEVCASSAELEVRLTPKPIYSKMAGG